MQFNRFTRFGFFSNWGSYSPTEVRLLDKEAEVGQYINSLEGFIRAKAPVKWLINRFRQIELNTAVKENEYSSLEVELDQMIKGIKEIRLNVLNRGGKDIPNAPTTFPNHQPAALVGEIQTFLDYRKRNRNKGDFFSTGFVIHYQADLKQNNAANFHQVVRSGGKVLYTLDVDGILSIGDPRSTKHSVVAVGKQCKAAGIAQLEIDDRTDMYKSMIDQKSRALDLKTRLENGEDDPKNDLRNNMEYLQHEAQSLESQLNGWVPPVNQTNTVLIDFDSGHYHPNQAWKEAMQGWAMAGYKAKWNPDSRRV